MIDTLTILWLYGIAGTLIALGMGLYEHLTGDGYRE
jgi:hypothetical protein